MIPGTPVLGNKVTCGYADCIMMEHGGPDTAASISVAEGQDSLCTRILRAPMEGL